jgi:16S rRNA (guanine527-N7)-methyltransferase
MTGEPHSRTDRAQRHRLATTAGLVAPEADGASDTPPAAASGQSETPEASPAPQASDSARSAAPPPSTGSPVTTARRPSANVRPLTAAVLRLLRASDLPAELALRLHLLLDLLAEPDAPTAVHDPEAAVDVHLADSLTGLEVPQIRQGRRLADLGAGAGLPGLPLALALPEAHVTLVESHRRKCAFLERAISELGLTNAAVRCGRAEELGAPATFDAVTARALASLPVLCEYAAPLLAEGGVLVAWKGAVEPWEEADGLAAAAALGLARTMVWPVQPYEGSEKRTLHVFRKVAPTPAGYPRRPGIAVKRPLRTMVKR